MKAVQVPKPGANIQLVERELPPPQRGFRVVLTMRRVK
jgi:hypothetical protein